MRRNGFHAAKPGELLPAIKAGLAADGPTIIDCVVTADEMPNFPHLDLDKAGHYALAKIKEANPCRNRAVTGLPFRKCQRDQE